MARKFNQKAFKKRLDVAWSKVVRARDGKCLVCETRETLQSHHCFITKARSNFTRWNTTNGITLCYVCHICKLHGSSDKVFLDTYLSRLNDLVPQETQDEIRILSNNTFKLNQANLEEKMEELIELENNTL